MDFFTDNYADVSDEHGERLHKRLLPWRRGISQMGCVHGYRVLVDISKGYSRTRAQTES